MTYEFDETMEMIEKYSKGYSRPSQEKMAEEAGVTRVTLRRRIDKALNDLHGLQDRYGSVYVNMYIDGIDEVVDGLSRGDKISIAHVLHAKSERVFMVEAGRAPGIFASKWYQALVEEHGTTRERAEAEEEARMQLLMEEFKKLGKF